jgi:glycosyltransferase involved in cell wall biosynthesis
MLPSTGPRVADRPTERNAAIVRTAFVATYPPRHCGVATFTHHLAASTGSREIVALHPAGQATPYPIEVHHRIRRDEQGDYAPAARAVSGCVDVVAIQHERGIWGGDDGAHVLDFVRALRVPAVTTLHGILADPSATQRAILGELLARSVATVVMSDAAATLLTAAYGVDARRIEVIPHGVPDLPLVDPETVKPTLGVAGRSVVLSFGLLGPGKGVELAIEALPRIVAAHPSVLYVIVGETHPDLLGAGGTAYRSGLLARIRKLGLTEHVRFVDRFVGRNELIRWLEATDVFVSPHASVDTVLAGTLAYAVGAGRAIVSTPYPYAVEMLADGRGILVAPGSPSALAAEVGGLLADRARRDDIGRAAYEHSRGMVWSAVGSEYGRLFARIAGSPVRVSPFAQAAVGA